MITEQGNTLFSLNDLCELAKLEGDLLMIAAYEQLGIGQQLDEDGFTNNIWAIGRLAETFACKYTGDPVRYRHPTCKVLFDDVNALGRTICPGAWDFFLNPASKKLSGYQSR